MSANVDLPDHVGPKEDSPRAAVLAAALGYGLDGYDLLILSFALTGIITTFGVSTVEAGSLVTVTLIGAVVGGLVFGPLSDRFGRVRVLTWSVLFFALFTGLSALAQDFTQLAVTRFLAGIGIGGEFGVGMTLAAEAVLPRSRARATAWVAVGFQLGVLAAALLSAPLISWFGWRGLFVVGAAQGLLVFLVRRHLSEPAVFQGHAGKPYAAGRFRRSVRAFVATPAARRLTVALVVLTSVQNCGYYGIMTWLPKYLSTRFGLDLVESSVWTAVTVGGMITGILTFGQVADRAGRRTAFWIFQAGAAMSVLVYSHITDDQWLLPAGFVMGFFANGMLGGYGALIAEHYATSVRSTAENVLFNLGRGVGGFAPVAIAAVASAHGFAVALSILPAIYVLAFLAMFAIPERRAVNLAAVGRSTDHSG